MKINTRRLGKLFFWLSVVLCVWVYVYSIYYAFLYHWIAAFLVACMPIVGQGFVLWFISAGAGTIFNPFGIACLALIVSTILGLLFSLANEEI